MSTSQSSQPSQAVTSVSGSCNNGTSTQSTVSTTRSTRSQNPEFLARHRSFLHKLHLASSSNITDEELYTDDDESTTSKTTSRSSGSVQTEDTSSLTADSLSVRRKRERSASNGTMSPRIPSPSVSSMIGGSASANNSGSSSPAGSQMQPATKKRRTTRTDSAGAQVSPGFIFCFGCGEFFELWMGRIYRFWNVFLFMMSLRGRHGFDVQKRWI